METFEAARVDEARRALAMELHLNFESKEATPVTALLPVFNLSDEITLNTWINVSNIASKVTTRLRLRAQAFINLVAIFAILALGAALAFALIVNPKFK